MEMGHTLTIVIVLKTELQQVLYYGDFSIFKSILASIFIQMLCKC